MASVVYGPEAIVLVLALGGAAALGLTLPITVAIAVLFLVTAVNLRGVATSARLFIVGGLPVLSQLLAKDHYLPHVFQLRGQRQVYRYGILFLAGVSAILLIAARGDMNTLAGEALSVARGLGHDVVAVHAVNTADTEDTKAFVRLLDDWQRWQPGVPLIALYDQRRTLTAPVVQYVNHCELDTVFVLIPEVEPDHMWQRLLQNQRGAILAHALRRRTNAVVCRMRFRIIQPTCTQGRLERLGSARLSTSRVTGGTSPSPEMR